MADRTDVVASYITGKIDTSAATHALAHLGYEPPIIKAILVTAKIVNRFTCLPRQEAPEDGKSYIMPPTSFTVPVLYKPEHFQRLYTEQTDYQGATYVEEKLVGEVLNKIHDITNAILHPASSYNNMLGRNMHTDIKDHIIRLCDSGRSIHRAVDWFLKETAAVIYDDAKTYESDIRNMVSRAQRVLNNVAYTLDPTRLKFRLISCIEHYLGHLQTNLICSNIYTDTETILANIDRDSIIEYKERAPESWWNSLRFSIEQVPARPRGLSDTEKELLKKANFNISLQESLRHWRDPVTKQEIPRDDVIIKVDTADEFARAALANQNNLCMGVMYKYHINDRLLGASNHDMELYSFMDGATLVDCFIYVGRIPHWIRSNYYAGGEIVGINKIPLTRPIAVGVEKNDRPQKHHRGDAVDHTRNVLQQAYQGQLKPSLQNFDKKMEAIIAWQHEKESMKTDIENEAKNRMVSCAADRKDVERMISEAKIHDSSSSTSSADVAISPSSSSAIVVLKLEHCAPCRYIVAETKTEINGSELGAVSNSISTLRLRHTIPDLKVVPKQRVQLNEQDSNDVTDYVKSRQSYHKRRLYALGLLWTFKFIMNLLRLCIMTAFLITEADRHDLVLYLAIIAIIITGIEMIWSDFGWILTAVSLFLFGCLVFSIMTEDAKTITFTYTGESGFLIFKIIIVLILGLAIGMVILHNPVLIFVMGIAVLCKMKSRPELIISLFIYIIYYPLMIILYHYLGFEDLFTLSVDIDLMKFVDLFRQQYPSA